LLKKVVVVVVVVVVFVVVKKSCCCFLGLRNPKIIDNLTRLPKQITVWFYNHDVDESREHSIK
jgi:hypothetical protein